MALHKVILLPGDGIGPEILAPTVQVLHAVAAGEFEYEQHAFGGASIDEFGVAMTDETLEACRRAEAVLLAAVGGPKWDTTDPAKPRPEQGLLGLRKGLGLFANLRPVKPIPALYDASPLKREVIEHTDLLVVRELTGGIYFGDKTRTADSASDACVYTRAEIERIARVAFGAAKSRVTSVDKANVLETSRLWREVVRDVHGTEFPNIELEHLLVDNAAMRLVAAPRHFEVILTENMFGDILSDEAAMLTGSLGMLPSASVGDGGPGVFEPVHGSAPDIAGQGIANPLAMFLSAALMLRHGFGMEAEAAAIESAVDRALAEGLRTPDLGGDATTAQATQEVIKHLLRSRVVEQADLIWHNGELVAWEDAKIHVLTHGLHYGTGVFEGERAYETPRGTAIFRHRDHLDRLMKSAELYYMPVPYSLEELRSATHELIAANGFRECYIRPIIYRGYGQMGLYPLDCEVSVSIAAWVWPAYLGEESKRTGVRAKVSSWRRISGDSLIPHSKASGQYLNSVLAKIEASKAGYQEAILLDSRGFVCEGSGENIYAVRDGQIITPPQWASILDGINRRSILTIARDLGYDVIERDMARAELTLADEVFFSGTAAELVPIREIDDHTIGDGSGAGPITREIQRVHDDALHGREPRYAEWLDIVAVPSGHTAA